MLYRGMLVALPEGRGIGKLEGIEDGTCTVKYFPVDRKIEQDTVPRFRLQESISKPTNSSLCSRRGSVPRRPVANYFVNDNGLVDYDIRFPNSKKSDVSELALYLRPWTAPEDPALVMARSGAESQYLHDHTADSDATAPEASRRGAGHDCLGFCRDRPRSPSSRRRASRLNRPVQRYLLADEVGLGKTIEAGLIVRQHLIDDPATRVLIAVPDHLCGQWRSELETKLRMDQFDGSVEVISMPIWQGPARARHPGNRRSAPPSRCRNRTSRLRRR